MQYRWFSVNPRLTSSSAFDVFKSIPGGDAIKPRRLAKDQPEFVDYEFKFRMSNLVVDASLGVAGIADIDASVEVTTAVLDMQRYATGETPTEGMNGDLVKLTRWGVGLRVHFIIRTIKAGAKINTLNALAASAELGYARATYSVETFGINDPGIITEFPGPGRFDAEVAASLLRIGTKIKNDQFVDETKRTSVPFQIYSPYDLFHDQIAHARSITFAVTRIAERMPFAKAIEAARARDGFSELAVARVYDIFDLTTKVPQDKDQKRAEAWLAT